MTRFQTTRWSLIEAARDDPESARSALEQLCRAYRPPALAFIRRSGYRGSDAEDLVQAFFVRFLERGWYADASPERGRFRWLLLTALQRFLIDQHAQSTARKRGNGRIVNLGDAMDSIADSSESPEQAYTRAWLATVVSHAVARLQTEWELAGKREQFDRLAPLLVERPEASELQKLADECGLRSNTLAVQAHRMRRRLRQLVRLELMQTVANRESLEVELAELRGAIDWSDE